MKLEPGAYRVDPGRAYRSPKEIWGFRERVPRGDPVEVAKTFLKANVETLKIQDALPNLGLRALVRGVGATHVIFQQRHERIRVHRGFVTVHISRDNEVYLVKSRAAPARHLPRGARFRLTPSHARDAALDYLETKWGAAERTRTGGRVKRWFFHKGELRPAWRVRFSMFGPREEWIVYVDADTGEVLRTWDNLALARGRIFDPSPLATVDHKDLYDTRADAYYPIPPAAFKSRTLPRLSGAGRVLTGKHVSTSLTSPRASAKNGSFHFDYERESSGFLETMAYYHIDQAIQYVESLGYAGRRRLFKKPVHVNAAWEELDDHHNSYFDPVTKELHFGLGGVPDAEDAEVILHELGHALQDAICSDFGQSREASAIGEGFGDYLAASFFEKDKPPEYRERVMSWSAMPYDVWRRRTPPFLRRVDEDVTLADFENRRDHEHINGEIWSSALWDIREELGGKADATIIDSHFQLDAYTKLRRAARAVIDADDNLRGGNRQRLHEIFIGHGFAGKDLQG